MVRSPKLLVLLSLLLIGSAVFPNLLTAQTPAPRIFYTDIVSGPNSGGQNNNGAFITIYGNNFGSTRGTSAVTLNGASAVSYPSWTNTKITVQIGSAATSGNLVVNVNGALSNGSAFTVRSGRIFFVSTSGNDGNSGSYSSPWATLIKARNTAVAGDIVYVLNGVQQTGADLSSASLTISTGGTSSAPIAFVAYPNATVTIGTTSGQTYGIRTAPNTSPRWIVLAGFTLRGVLTAVDMTGGYNWRVVGNDISCPNGSGVGGCVNGSASGGSKLFGNNIHDTGSTSSSNISQYSGMNFVNTSSLDIGWNNVGNTRGCDAVKVRSSSQLNYGVKVHDNNIHDVRCSGVVVGNMDTTKGAVSVYNNLIVRAGTGPDPGGVQSEAYAGVYVASSANGVKVMNNTFYDCGSRKSSKFGCSVSDSTVTLQNNIFNVLTGEWFLGFGAVTPAGSNNLCYGLSQPGCPSALSNSVTSDPQFVDIANNDFRLTSTSGAIDKGMNTGIGVDIAGTTRPKGAAYDIGAYESYGTTAPSTAVNLTVNPTSLSFGSVTVGQSSTASGSLTNSSTTTSITLTSANVTGSGFTVSGLSFPVTLAPSASVNYTAKFAPTASGTATGNISFVSDATNSPVNVSLSGSGTATAVGTLSANPTSLAFGSITTATTSTKSVAITNSGSANVSISSVTASGAGFTVSGITTPLTLTPGQSASLSVKFAPTTAAGYTGTVTISSNASNPSLSVGLSGTGVAPTTTHSVTVSWTASTSSGVSGYNVYRSVTSGGPYSKINSSLVAGTTYTDNSVNSGSTYYYVVRAVDPTGTESANSAQATAVIP